MLIRLAKAGRVAGVLAGPPCETWSIARFREPVQEVGRPRARPPRPLGLASRPCGGFLAFLSEHQISSPLAAAVERPAEPWGPPGAPSSWHLNLAEDLLQQPGAEKHLIHQCAFGAPSREPTCFMGVHFGALRDALQARPRGSSAVTLEGTSLLK
eukprot:3254823-Pyramimonas_sp.AAC.1